MVQVTVGDNHCAYFGLSFFQIFGIWQDIVYTRSVFIFELETYINDDDVIAIFYDGHITTDLFHTSKWHYSNRCWS